MKNKEKVFLILIIVILLYILYIITDGFNNNLFLNCLILASILILVIYTIGLILMNENKNNFMVQDKLFKSLIKNSNTIYILFNSKNNKILYLSDNVESVLGISCKEKSIEDITYKIFNTPIIKSELDNWDKTNDYVSQLLKYDNPKYNYQMWIRIKIFPYKEKKEEYFIIEIYDATKEHDRQHLLVKQATDIKARESQLNQITASSYDVEMNVNIINNTYDLKYFKKDNLYFGDEKRGNYTEGLKTILNYINENDRELVYSNFSINNLKENFSKYELDSKVIRYRLGNNIKNNIWLESTIFFIYSKQNNRVSILTKNVTENAESIREQNIMLQNALNDARMADKAKTALISTISHDIRVPLTNIMGISDSLLKENIIQDIKEDIKIINLSSNEMLEIIDGLIDVSKLNKKNIKKEECEYNLLKLFKDLEKNTKDYALNKDISVSLNLDNNLPVIVFGDKKRIKEILTKIINNSLKYTDEGEININVRGEKKDANVNLIIEISDTGKGMDENKLNEIINTKDNTTGIGLVKSLIKLLDGKLEIESKLDEYTKVTISVVQKIVEDNKIRELISNNKKTLEFSLKGKNILIVDDNKLNLKVTSKLLKPFDVDVTLLESGQECIEHLKEQNVYDLILMDIMMPGIDGIETLKQLKSIENFNTPVVALTADVIEGQKEKYLSSGFDDYLSKPIDKVELSRVLKKFLKDH